MHTAQPLVATISVFDFMTNFTLNHHDTLSAFGDSETNLGLCQHFKGMILEINFTEKLLCD